MHIQTSSHIRALGLSFCLLCIACTPDHFSNTNLFKEIFLEGTGTFRGTTLGEPIELVKEHEAPNEPVHEDILGLSYELPLGENRKMLIAYYKDNLKTETESNRVASIIANIQLRDELESAQLYNEIQEYFIQNNQYGLASGTYGDYTWESRIKRGMEVRLKLDENKRVITLNFIDTQIGTQALN